MNINRYMQNNYKHEIVIIREMYLKLKKKRKRKCQINKYVIIKVNMFEYLKIIKIVKYSPVHPKSCKIY